MEENSITSPLINCDDQVGVQIQSAKGRWRSAVYLIGAEVGERFAMFGVYGNLISYLTDVLNESTATAAKNVNLWYSATTLLPLLGAFVADTYFGRFNTIFYASLIYVMGLVMLVISVSVVPLKFRHVTFFLSLYLVAIGEGGHKPCVQTFGADQFDENSPDERKAKSSFFNWWYFSICAAAGSAMLIVTYVQDNVGWLVGFGIPALAMAISLFIFLLGQSSYRKHTLRGSPLVRILQVFVAAFRKRNLRVSIDGYVDIGEQGEDVSKEIEPNCHTLTHTIQFRFLDKAMIEDEIDMSKDTINNWRLCTVHQVEEAKLLLRLVPIWLNCLIYAVVFAQGSTFFTKQGDTMDRSILGHDFKVPAASLQVFTGIAVMLFVPIYDRILVPNARRITGAPSGITMLQRIGCGMFLITIEMVIAALVETQRLRIASEHGLIDEPNTTVPMSVWWLVPQYVTSGVSDVFTVVGMQELFYDQMPEDMRSIGSAAYLSVMGIGSLLSSGIISVVQYVSSKCGEEWLVNNINLGHLNYFYWLLALLSILGLGTYIAAAKNFVYKKSGGHTLVVNSAIAGKNVLTNS